MINALSKKDLTARYAGRTVLVTGANGFVGGYLVPRLVELGVAVYGIGRREHPQAPGYSYYRCDLNEFEAVKQCIARVKPDFVFHLASQSSVGTSWSHEWETVETNVRITYHLFKVLEYVRRPVRVLLVSSGEVYGDLGGRKAVESDPLRPMNPYAVSKAMMEIMAHRFQSTNVDYVIARAFNHTGPGRPEYFFESSVVKQFVMALKEGKERVQLLVGNIDVVRDYSDVRDVVEKYLLLALQGKSCEAYNVCSGVGVSLREAIRMIEEITQIHADIEVEKGKLRKNDICVLVGTSQFSNQVNSIPFKTTLMDLVKYFFDKI